MRGRAGGRLDFQGHHRSTFWSGVPRHTGFLFSLACPLPTSSISSPYFLTIGLRVSVRAGSKSLSSLHTHVPPYPVYRRCSINACSTLVSEHQPASPGSCARVGFIQGNRKEGQSGPALQPLPHKVGAGPGPPAALVHALDHCLRAVLHLAGHSPCHRVMAPVPVGRTTVTLALLVPEVLTAGLKASPTSPRGLVLLGKGPTENSLPVLRARERTHPP